VDPRGLVRMKGDPRGLIRMDGADQDERPLNGKRLIRGDAVLKEVGWTWKGIQENGGGQEVMNLDDGHGRAKGDEMTKGVGWTRKRIQGVQSGWKGIQGDSTGWMFIEE